MTREKILNEARFWAPHEMLLTASLVSPNGYILVGALNEGGAWKAGHTVDNVNSKDRPWVEPEAPVHVFPVDVGGNALHISTDKVSGELIPVGEEMVH